MNNFSAQSCVACFSNLLGRGVYFSKMSFPPLQPPLPRTFSFGRAICIIATTVECKSIFALINSPVIEAIGFKILVRILLAEA